MNARQKAKQLKRRLELMKRMPMPVSKEYPRNVKTYYVRQTVDTGYLNELSADAECARTYINRELVRQLAETIANEVEFRLEPSRIPYHTDITAEITVANIRR